MSWVTWNSFLEINKFLKTFAKVIHRSEKANLKFGTEKSKITLNTNTFSSLFTRKFRAIQLLTFLLIKHLSEASNFGTSENIWYISDGCKGITRASRVIRLFVEKFPNSNQNSRKRSRITDMHSLHGENRSISCRIFPAVVSNFQIIASRHYF